MTTIIKFNDNIEHIYDSFEEILNLENYNDIIYIKSCGNKLSGLPELPNSLINMICHNNILSSLPELPNSLIRLDCANNNLSSLPELPNSLEILFCNNNNISNLPKLPNKLTILYCWINNLFSLPEIPNSLKILYCYHNNLSSLPELPYLILNSIYYNDNPVHDHINDYFNGKIKNYLEHQKKMKKIIANKIGNWFLDCKYNPKYLYCRKRLMKEYEELYG
jgi:hypothetical protein